MTCIVYNHKLRTWSAVHTERRTWLGQPPGTGFQAGAEGGPIYMDPFIRWHGDSPAVALGVLAAVLGEPITYVGFSVEVVGQDWDGEFKPLEELE